MAQPFWDEASAAAYTGPDYATNPYDTAYVAGLQFPGIVTVAPARARHLDIQALPGQAPTIRLLGFEPTRFPMTCRVWTPSQWTLLQAIMEIIQPFGFIGPSKTVFDISHPLLAQWKIRAGVCLKMGPLVGEGPGPRTLQMEWLQRSQEKPGVSTAMAAIAVTPALQASPTTSIQAANGKTTTFSPTQGPQVPPSQGPISLP